MVQKMEAGQDMDTKRSEETRTKIVREARCTPAEFVAMLSQTCSGPLPALHTLIRPSGAADEANNCGCRISSAESEAAISPPRLSWRNSLLRDFHVDPLLDNDGQQMHWVRH